MADSEREIIVKGKTELLIVTKRSQNISISLGFIALFVLEDQKKYVCIPLF
jgi:hypothetical protein